MAILSTNAEIGFDVPARAMRLKLSPEHGTRAPSQRFDDVLIPCGLALGVPRQAGSLPMSEDIASSPSLFVKRFGSGRKIKRQHILDLVSGSSAGITRQDLAAALGSTTNCVSVMISQINTELTEQGWKIGFTEMERQLGRRGALGRRYRLVRQQKKITSLVDG
jgi:hypothetical protein